MLTIKLLTQKYYKGSINYNKMTDIRLMKCTENKRNLQWTMNIEWKGKILLDGGPSSGGILL